MSTPSNDLRAKMNAVVELATNPILIAAVKDIQAATTRDDQLAIANTALARQSLTNQGVAVPDGFRIALREFSDPASRTGASDTVITEPLAPAGLTTPVAISPDDTTICASVGYIVCVSVGQS